MIRSSEKFTLKTKPFGLSLYGFTTDPKGKGVFNTDILIDDLLRLKLSSDIAVSPLRLDGDMDITDVELLKIYSYLKDDLDFRFGGDIREISNSFNIKIDEKLKADIKGLDIDLGGFEYDDGRFGVVLKDLQTKLEKAALLKDKGLDIKLSGSLGLKKGDISSLKGEKGLPLRAL